MDVFFGTELGLSGEPALTQAYIESSDVNADRDVEVAAASDMLIDAVTSNAAESSAGGTDGDYLYGAQGMGASAVIAFNVLEGATLAYIDDAATADVDLGADGVTQTQAGRDVSVSAVDVSAILSEVTLVASSATSSDGGLTQINETLGLFLDSDFVVSGAGDPDTFGTGGTADVTSVDLGFGDRVRLTRGYEAAGDGAGAQGLIYRFMGDAASGVNLDETDFTNLDLWQEVPETSTIPTGYNLTSSDSMALGATLSRNQIDVETEARILRGDVVAERDVSVSATQDADIEAVLDTSVESSGGSVWGTGESVAGNGVLAFNSVQNEATARVEDGSATAGRHVSVTAANDGRLAAEIHNATTSGADAVGIVVAFNTVGYRPGDIVTQALDTYYKTDIASEDPSDVTARVSGFAIHADGSVAVTAQNAATLDATIDTRAKADAAAFFGASGFAATGVMASNRISASAVAEIVELEGAAMGVVGSRTEDTPDANFLDDVTVSATDAVLLKTRTDLDTTVKKTNDLGAGLINDFAQSLLDNYEYTDESGLQTLEFGDRVWVGSDVPGEENTGQLYRWMGPDGTALDLGALPADRAYDDPDWWKAVDATNVVPGVVASSLMKALDLSAGDSEALTGLVTRNEATGGALARVENIDIVATGDVTVTATERATLSAIETSSIAAVKATGGILAMNELNSSAEAKVVDSSLDTTAGTEGDITISALNLAALDAKVLTSMTATTEGAAATIALNAVGFDSSILYFQVFDALLGSDYLLEKTPASATATALNADLLASGDVLVTADSRETLFEFDSAEVEATAQALDDAGTAEGDSDDEDGDAAILGALADRFAAEGIEFDAQGLRVETVETGAFWFVTDAEGRAWQVKRDFGALAGDASDDVLTVALVNIVNARVGNEVAQEVTNSKVLVDRMLAQQKLDKSKDTDKKLKYGSNGQASGGALATNRINSSTSAVITSVGHDFESSQTVDALRTGDRVLHGGQVYEYVGEDQAPVESFDYTSRTRLLAVDGPITVRLHEDAGGFAQGDILRYDGPGIAAEPTIASDASPASLATGALVEVAADTGDFAAGALLRYTGDPVAAPDIAALLVSAPGDFEVYDGEDLSALIADHAADWTQINAPIAVNLANGAQSYATNDDWRAASVFGGGTLEAGGAVTVDAVDSANVVANISLDVSSSVSNNVDGLVGVAVELLSADYDYTTNSGAQTVTEGQRVRVATEHGGEAALKTRVFEWQGPAPLAVTDWDAVDFGAGWVDVTTLDDVLADAFPNVGNLADSNSRAVGGLIALNDARGEVFSAVIGMDVEAGGPVSVTAQAQTAILSTLLSNVSSSGGSAWGTGESLAVNGQIATNLVQSQAEALVLDSEIAATGAGALGDVTVAARNAATLDATLAPSTKAGDTAVSVTLAFNTLGWESSNVLFSLVETVLTDPLISEELLGGLTYSSARAQVLNSDIDAAGAVAVTAESDELLNATLSNSTVSEASALKGAEGKSIGFAVASNKIAGKAVAAIDNSGAAAGTQVSGDLGVSVVARDDILAFANTKLTSDSSTSNDGGAAVFQETLNDLTPADWVATDDAQSVFLQHGQLVRLSDDFSGAGEAGKVYVWMGDDDVETDLAGATYTDPNFWKEFALSSIVPTGFNVSDSNSTGAAGLLVYNELRGGATARVIEAELRASGGAILVEAVENARMEARTDSIASSSGGSALGEGTSLAVNGVIATNLLLASADASVADSDLTAGGGADGDITVRATNTGELIAETLADTSTGDTAVGVLMAINSAGWSPTSRYLLALEALIGSPEVSDAEFTDSFAGEQPVSATARVINSDLDASGAVLVEATNTSLIDADTSGDATSSAGALTGASGKAFGAVIAYNRLSSESRAILDVADWREGDGKRWARTGERFETEAGAIWELTGEDMRVDFDGFDPSADDDWTLVAGGAAQRNDVDGHEGVTVSATDSATLQADNTMEAITTVSNDGGISTALGALDSLANEYQFTQNSGERQIRFGQKVLHAAGTEDPADDTLYMFVGEDPNDASDDTDGYVTVDLATTDFTDETLWKEIDPVDLAGIFGILNDVGFNFNISESDATAAGGLISLNDLRADTDAIVGRSDVDASDGSIAVTATETATVEATNTGIVKADGGSVFAAGEESSTVLAVNAIIATNPVLGEARAIARDAAMTALDAAGGVDGGDLTVAATNAATIEATTTTTTRVQGGGGDSIGIGVALAFNSVGIAPQNVLFNTVDALLGTSIGDVDRARAYAAIEGGSAVADDALSVTATNAGTIEAQVENTVIVTSVSIGSSEDEKAIAVAPIVTLNRVASGAVANVVEADELRSNAGAITVSAADAATIRAEVLAASASVSLNLGSGKSLSVAIAASIARNQIDALVDAAILGTGTDALPISAAGGVSVLASQDASVTAVVRAVAASVSVGGGGAFGASGGGAISANAIQGATTARLVDSVVQASAVRVDAGSAAVIDSDVLAAAVTASGGLNNTTAVAVGLSIAENNIGFGTVAVEDSDILAPAEVFGSDETVALETGDVVRIVGDFLRLGQVFEFVGETPPEDVDLSLQDYSNPDLWKRIDIARSGLVTQALMENTALLDNGAADADLAVEATGDQSISASVLAAAGAVAVGLGGNAAAVSAAGVFARNRIGSDVSARVSGDDAPGSASDGIVVSRASVSAEDTSSIGAAVTSTIRSARWPGPRRSRSPSARATPPASPSASRSR